MRERKQQFISLLVEKRRVWVRFMANEQVTYLHLLYTS